MSLTLSAGRKPPLRIIFYLWKSDSIDDNFYYGAGNFQRFGDMSDWAQVVELQISISGRRLHRPYTDDSFIVELNLRIIDRTLLVVPEPSSFALFRPWAS